jgi:hypothetical protein
MFQAGALMVRTFLKPRSSGGVDNGKELLEEAMDWELPAAVSDDGMRMDPGGGQSDAKRKGEVRTS